MVSVLHSRVLLDVRNGLVAEDLAAELPLCREAILDGDVGGRGRGTTRECKIAYVDDIMHGTIAKEPERALTFLTFPAQFLKRTTREHGFELSFKPGKAEAILCLRGSNAAELKAHLAADGGLTCGGTLLRLVPT